MALVISNCVALQNGYFIDIPAGNETEVAGVLAELHNVGFIDEYTRALAVQFVVYNGNAFAKYNTNDEHSIDSQDETVSMFDVSVGLSPSGSLSKYARIASLQVKPLAANIINSEEQPGWFAVLVVLQLFVLSSEMSQVRDPTIWTVLQ